MSRLKVPFPHESLNELVRMISMTKMEDETDETTVVTGRRRVKDAKCVSGEFNKHLLNSVTRMWRGSLKPGYQETYTLVRLHELGFTYC